MTTRITTSELDITAIKSSLQSYLENSGLFNDADFTASGWSTILDVLAYNTHINALIANFSLNEIFLDSAQLRSSVVSIAKALGYTPRSVTGASAIINVSVLSVPDATPALTLPKNTAFTTTIDGESYTFYTRTEYTADSSTDYVFENVDIYEGALRTKKFFIEALSTEREIYVIPDPNVDTSTMEVIVRGSFDSSDIEIYTRPTIISDLTSTSLIYFLSESPNGYWEIQFGNDIIGKSPARGSVAEVTYLSSSGDAANFARTFTTSTTVETYSLSVATVTAASGGNGRESLDSIRFNTPKRFATQNRAITASDFKSIIQGSVSYIQSINVWGGQDNVPPDYGRVYISIAPNDADVLSDIRKQDITNNILRPRSVLTITPIFVDPTYQYLELSGSFRYNGNVTSLTDSQLESLVAATITAYADNNFTTFNTAFRKSVILNIIDDSSEAILSSNMSVLLQSRFKPTLNVNSTYNIPFTQSIASVTSSSRVITSSEFVYAQNGVNYTCFLRNKTNSTTLEVYRVSGQNEIIVLDNAGYIDTVNNQVVITPFGPVSYPLTSGIRIKAKPADENTIVPLRNQLIRLDEDRLAFSAISESSTI